MVETTEIFEPIDYAYIAPPSTCPNCQQSYIRTDTLRNPDRTIYIHRQSSRVSKNAVDWCVDPKSREEQQKRLSTAIAECNEINQKEVEKGVDRRVKEMAESEMKMKVRVVSPKKGTHQREVGASQGISIQSERGKEMAFIGFDIVKLKEEFPTAQVGRSAKPSVAISDKGRITFSTEVSKVYDGCNMVIPARDKENQLRIRFDGLAEAPKGKETQVIELARPKAKPGKKVAKNVSINATFILKFLKYDFAKAGNQTFDIEKMDMEKHSVVFSLPATLPAKKAKRPMKARKPKVAAQVVNGKEVGQATPEVAGKPAMPAASNVAPPTNEDELAIEE